MQAFKEVAARYSNIGFSSNESAKAQRCLA
jgi:hypothetical protein